MYRLPDHLWPPQRRGIEQTIDLLNAGYNVCLYSPTGGGKTEQAIQLLTWACVEKQWRGVFLVNRRLLIAQTADRFRAADLPFGIRAAEYEDCFDDTAPFQICGTATEYSRVYQTGAWKLPEAGLVVVDEAHMQKAKMMQRILTDYKAMGARVVLMTATPVGLSHLADQLVISGKLQEYRACKALVPAVVRSIEQPDMSKVRREPSGEGEYTLTGQWRKKYYQHIVGHVIDGWKKYNPDGRPTLAYWPGVQESRWGTEQFRKAGVPWCHIDATGAVLDGKQVMLTRALWAEIQARYIANNIKGLSSRLKLREGVDLPCTYHCILATPIGSLKSYLQTVGRVLRYSPETPDHVLVSDHGGAYLTHGSVNEDRPWRDWWNLPEHVISEWHVKQIQERKIPEPIRCPMCEGERKGGITCPHCGFQHEKGQRHVIMEDGRMVIKEGPTIRPPYRPERMQPDTQKLWSDMIWGHRRSRRGGQSKSFAQVEAFFFQQYGYYPPRTLDFMPKDSLGWYRKVGAVDWETDLRQPASARSNSG